MIPEYRFPLKRKCGFLHIGTPVSNLRNWGVKPPGILRQRNWSPARSPKSNMINGVIPIQKWNGNRPAGIWTLCVKSEKLKILQIKKSQQKRSCQIVFTQFSKTFSIGFSWILPDNLRRKVNKCFSASVIILLSNRTLIGFKRPVYAGSQILLLIQTRLCSAKT